MPEKEKKKKEKGKLNFKPVKSEKKKLETRS